jgi:hypothetical protein
LKAAKSEAPWCQELPKRGVLRGLVIGCLLLLRCSRASVLAACSSASSTEGSQYFETRKSPEVETALQLADTFVLRHYDGATENQALYM